jgi:AcrR family transcriptional regulator
MPKVSVEYEQQQREMLIEGAALAFAEKGYRETKIDDIGEKLKLSKGKIYLYFKSKEELFAAVFETFQERRLKEIREAYRPEDIPLVKIEKVLDQFVDLLVKQEVLLCRLWLEFYLEGPKLPAFEDLSQRMNEAFYQEVYKLLVEGQQNGDFKTGLDLHGITSIILATCDGLMLRAMVANKHSNPVALRQVMWDTFYNLLKA